MTRKNSKTQVTQSSPSANNQSVDQQAQSDNRSIATALRTFDAPIPLWKGLPFGLQHVMAMFVANLTPLILIASAAAMDTSQRSWLIQGGLLVAGLGTVLKSF